MRAAGAKFRDRKKKDAAQNKGKLVGAALQAYARREERERVAAAAATPSQSAEGDNTPDESVQMDADADDDDDASPSSAPKREIPTCKCHLPLPIEVRIAEFVAIHRFFGASTTQSTTGEEVLRRYGSNCALHRSQVGSALSQRRSVRHYQTIWSRRRQCLSLCTRRRISDHVNQAGKGQHQA